jgi:hypothetical protein
LARLHRAAMERIGDWLVVGDVKGGAGGHGGVS